MQLFGAVHRGPFEHSLHIIRQNFQGEEGSENSSKEGMLSHSLFESLGPKVCCLEAIVKKKVSGLLLNP